MGTDESPQSNFLPPGMNRRHDLVGTRIVSPKALVVFNTVARHLNLVRAAEEMGVTQGALSKQIKALEQEMDVVLFQRGPRGLTLSQAGDVLYDYTSNAFSILQQGIARLTTKTKRESLVVSTARSFAVRVLAPRLRSFIDSHPWIDLQIDVHRYFADLSSSKADISIRAGDGHWPDYNVLRLTHDRLFPVCAPSLLNTDPGSASLDFLATMPRLAYIEKEDWRNWLDAAGYGHVPPAAGMIGFNDSGAMLAAAEAGVGLAMARSSLVADALMRGALLKPYSAEAEDGTSYYAVSALGTARRRSVRLFLQWLDTEFTLDRQAPPTPPPPSQPLLDQRQDG